MDSLNQYREIIKNIIEEYAQFQPARGDVQIEVVLDEKNDHYDLVYTGWNGAYRIHGSVIHIDIRNEKVWVQYDGTEDGVAEVLAQKGIPRDRIVLGFKPPEIRPYTDFAAG